MTYTKHETAIVDVGAEIGDETKVWHWTHVCGSAKIGSRCSLGQNVFVADNVSIGNNVKIQNNVSVYEGVIIEDDVFCGPSVVFTNVYNPRSEISRRDEYKVTLVKRGATLGANSTIICGVTIGDYAFVAAGAVVTRKIKPFSLMAGVPARQIGWIDAAGERLELPLATDETVECYSSGKTYILQNGSVKLSCRPKEN